MTFEFVRPQGLAPDPPKQEQATQDQAAGTPARPPQRMWLDLLEDRAGMNGLGSERLPSIVTVRAYHRERGYVPWEAAALDLPCRIHGWFAVAWVFSCTCMAWLGAGDYRRRLRKFSEEGLPGLVRAQLPPLMALSGFPRVWVAWWSAIAWTGLKFWRPIMTLFYLLMTTLPIVWPIFF